MCGSFYQDNLYPGALGGDLLNKSVRLREKLFYLALIASYLLVISTH